ncbi:unnamed protein product [Laminaria digitata]
MEGVGKLVCGNKEEYEAGEFHEDLRHGQGQLRSPTHTYEGTWAYDKMHGCGTLATRDGGVYIGRFMEGCTWNHGHITGHGTLVHGNGDRYTGGFEGGRRSGEGTMVSIETGYEFNGTFKNGVKNGPGRLRLPCGATVTGCWSSGKLVGQVDFKFPEKSIWDDPTY